MIIIFLSFTVENNVKDKPHLLISTQNSSGICKISNLTNIPYDLQNNNHNEYLSNYKVRGLAYDSSTNTMYYLLSESTYRLRSFLMQNDLNTNLIKVLFDQYKLTHTYENHPLNRQGLKNLVYDWVSKNIYMYGRKSILVANVENSWNVTEIISNRTRISGIAVHPNEALLFFLDSDKIYKSHLDGSKIIDIYKSSYNIENLVIDFYTNRLYWSSVHPIIQHVNFEGNDLKTDNNKSVDYNDFSFKTRSIAIDARYVYYINSNTGSVQRYRKNDGQEDEEFKIIGLNNSTITEIIVYDAESQKVKDDHPCKNNDSGCEKYCFALPKNNEGLTKVCGCGYDEKLVENKMSCERRIQEIYA